MGILFFSVGLGDPPGLQRQRQRAAQTTLQASTGSNLIFEARTGLQSGQFAETSRRQVGANVLIELKCYFASNDCERRLNDDYYFGILSS
eukprot:g54215.t1